MGQSSSNPRMNRVMNSVYFGSETYYRVAEADKGACTGCVFKSESTGYDCDEKYRQLDGTVPSGALNCGDDNTIFVNNNRLAWDEYIALRTTIKLKGEWSND
tara:strand:- start:493 stop:798 length:306 start_codon:yes stop_codon:yes gene_type:complete